jgi:hypothetical protein
VDGGLQDHGDAKVGKDGLIAGIQKDVLGLDVPKP